MNELPTPRAAMFNIRVIYLLLLILLTCSCRYTAKFHHKVHYSAETLVMELDHDAELEGGMTDDGTVYIQGLLLEDDRTVRVEKAFETSILTGDPVPVYALKHVALEDIPADWRPINFYSLNSRSKVRRPYFKLRKETYNTVFVSTVLPGREERQDIEISREYHLERNIVAKMGLALVLYPAGVIADSVMYVWNTLGALQ
jgi:hypothetical protein